MFYIVISLYLYQQVKLFPLKHFSHNAQVLSDKFVIPITPSYNFRFVKYFVLVHL